MSADRKLMHRLDRYLRGRLRYTDARDDPGVTSLHAVGGDPALGVYENPEGVEPQFLVFTRNGMGVGEPGAYRFIGYADIASIAGPSPLEGAREITVRRHDGSHDRIAIEGRQGSTQDLYSIWTFLRNQAGV